MTPQPLRRDPPLDAGIAELRQELEAWCGAREEPRGYVITALAQALATALVSDGVERAHRMRRVDRALRCFAGAFAEAVHKVEGP